MVCVVCVIKYVYTKCFEYCYKFTCEKEKKSTQIFVMISSRMFVALWENLMNFETI